MAVCLVFTTIFTGSFREGISSYDSPFAAAILAGLPLSLATVVQAATLTYFKTAGPADWNTLGNWTSGVPTSTVSAYIGGVGGYTATSSAGGNAVTLYLGITSASGTNPNPTVLTGPGTLDLSTAP